MTLKQRAEMFARDFLDDGDAFYDPDSSDVELLRAAYLAAAKEWAEKGFREGFMRAAYSGASSRSHKDIELRKTADGHWEKYWVEVEGGRG